MPGLGSDQNPTWLGTGRMSSKQKKPEGKAWLADRQVVAWLSLTMSCIIINWNTDPIPWALIVSRYFRSPSGFNRRNSHGLVKSQNWFLFVMGKRGLKITWKATQVCSSTLFRGSSASIFHPLGDQTFAKIKHLPKQCVASKLQVSVWESPTVSCL